MNELEINAQRASDKRKARATIRARRNKDQTQIIEPSLRKSRKTPPTTYEEYMDKLYQEMLDARAEEMDIIEQSNQRET